MENTFLVAGIISVTFLLFKFLEMRVIKKESRPLKELVKDSLIVYVCVIIGGFIFDQLKPVMKQVGGENVVPIAFTDSPGF